MRGDDELDKELRFHLDRQTAEHVAGGASPEDARRRTRLEFGGVLQIKDACRDVRLSHRLDALWQDLRFAARSLTRRPLLLVAAALSIAVGVGLNMGAYAALTRVLFGTSLSGAAPDERLVAISGEISFPNYNDLQSADTFTAMAAMQVGTLVWRAESGTTRIHAKIVSANFFDVVGVRPAYGRTFHGDDDLHTAVLGFGFWQRQFAADPSVIGRTLNLNGSPYVVIGILPKAFNAPTAPMMAAGVYVPIGPEVSQALSNRAAPQFDVIARLSGSITIAQAVSALTIAATELEQRYPRANARFGRSLSLQPTSGIGFWRQMAGDGFALLLGAASTVYVIVGLVLLVACANVAGLLLARAEERRREIAICATLGATRWRLAQRFVAESAIIAFAGVLMAVALYEVSIAVIASIAWSAGGLNLTLPALPLTYCGALVFIVTLACAVGPALSVSRTAPGPQAGHRTGAAGGRPTAGRNILVMTQVAICFVLLSGASVLLHGLLRLRNVDPGFDVVHLVAVNMRIPPSAGPQEPAGRRFDRLRQIIGSLPGVESVSSAKNLPLMFLTWRASVHTETAVDTHLAVDVYPVGSRYLETMRIPLLRGRDLGDDDLRTGMDTGRPIVVNETLVQRYLGAANPIGRQLVLESHGGGPDQLLQIVGVARDSKTRSLNEDRHPALYLPELGPNVLVRVAGPASGAVRMIQQAVVQSEPAAIVETSPMSAQVAFALMPTRIGSSVLAALGAIGLLMAMVGLYAVVNYSVNRRTFEIGVRLALGASRGGVLRMILQEGLAVVAIGCAIGGVIALVLTRALSPLLVTGQGPFDPAALGAVVGAMTVVGLAASLVPALRAARVDPIAALRQE